MIWGRQEPLHAVESASGRIPRGGGDQRSTDTHRRSGRVSSVDRQNPFFDGTAGCAVLLERIAAGDGGDVPARGRDRRSSPCTVRDEAGGEGTQHSAGHHSAKGRAR